MDDAAEQRNGLASRLDSARPAQARAAAWDVLDLAERLADAVTWLPHADPVAAMAAAQSCGDVRRSLTAPTQGSPADIPDDLGAGVVECAELLGRLASLLDAPGGEHLQPDPQARQAAAAHVRASHQALTNALRLS
ncbi:hypothetical protein [Streptomyces sp. NPDC059991]|uniref:hypothetical protein n=1 Tax=unclassified Streptomyces TaxID=2593676 RepID=UPI00369E10D2